MKTKNTKKDKKKRVKISKIEDISLCRCFSRINKRCSEKKCINCCCDLKCSVHKKSYCSCLRLLKAKNKDGLFDIKCYFCDRAFETASDRSEFDISIRGNIVCKNCCATEPRDHVKNTDSRFCMKKLIDSSDSPLKVTIVEDGLSFHILKIPTPQDNLEFNPHFHDKKHSSHPDEEMNLLSNSSDTFTEREALESETALEETQITEDESVNRDPSQYEESYQSSDITLDEDLKKAIKNSLLDVENEKKKEKFEKSNLESAIKLSLQDSKNRNFLSRSEEKEEKESETTCSICLDRKVNTFMSCGHCVCSVCFERMEEEEHLPKCHICRRVVRWTSNLYI